MLSIFYKHIRTNQSINHVIKICNLIGAQPAECHYKRPLMHVCSPELSPSCGLAHDTKMGVICIVARNAFPVTSEDNHCMLTTTWNFYITCTLIITDYVCKWVNRAWVRESPTPTLLPRNEKSKKQSSVNNYVQTYIHD